MRSLSALMLVLLLAACGRDNWNMTDISGGSPRLEFHLTRARDGALVTGADYRGKVVALYFGYANCPDVCPTTLASLAEAARQAGSADFRILFVTVDPDRDSAAVLRDYEDAFSPQMDGLRGTANQLADAARRYRVAFSVSKGPPYEVMHSNAVFFFDRSGAARLVTTDASNTGPLLTDLRRLLAE